MARARYYGIGIRVPTGIGAVLGVQLGLRLRLIRAVGNGSDL